MNHVHPQRQNWAVRHDAREAAEYQAIYRDIVLYEHPVEIRIGFELAFTRILAIPSMAELLIATGRITKNPSRRAHDTRVVMYEIFTGGLESPRAQRMVGLMNRLHGKYSIREDDMRHVLTALMITPTRTVARLGWRPLTDLERDATHQFYAELGQLIGVTSVPGTYRDAERLLDEYDTSHAARSHATVSLAHSTLGVLARQLPIGLRWTTPLLVSALLDNPALVEALGLPPALGTRRLVNVAAAARRSVLRRMPIRDVPEFTPGQPISSIYPNGYSLDDLGPNE